MEQAKKNTTTFNLERVKKSFRNQNEAEETNLHNVVGAKGVKQMEKVTSGQRDHSRNY